MAYDHTKSAQAVADLNARFRPLEALKVAQDAYQENPDLWPTTKTYIECLQALGRTEDADALLDKAKSQFSDLVAPYLIQFKACLDARDFAGCEDNLERAFARGLKQINYLKRRASLERKRGDAFMEIGHLEAIAELSGIEDLKAHASLADRLLALGETEKATTVITKLAEHHGDHKRVTGLEIQLLAVRGKYDEVEQRVQAWGKDESCTPVDILLFYQIWIQTRLTSLLKVVSKGVERWPYFPMLRICGFPLGMSKPAASVKDILARPEQMLPPKLIIDEAGRLAAIGKIAMAKQLILKFMERWPTGYDAGWDEQAPLILKVPKEGALKRELIQDPAGKDWIMSPEGASKRLVIVFTCVNGSAFMPLRMVDRYFAALNCQVLYLRDPSGNFYLNGVPSLGADIEDTLDAISKEVARVGRENVTVMGLSAGTFASVRYATRLNLPHAIQFSPLYQLGPPEGVVYNKMLIYDDRAPALRTRIGPVIHKAFPFLSQDLINAEPDFKADVFYSPNVLYDMTQATKMRSYENVSLWPIHQGKRHNILSFILKEDLLGDLISQKYDRIRECFPPE